MSHCPCPPSPPMPSRRHARRCSRPCRHRWLTPTHHESSPGNLESGSKYLESPPTTLIHGENAPLFEPGSCSNLPPQVIAPPPQAPAACSSVRWSGSMPSSELRQPSRIPRTLLPKDRRRKNEGGERKHGVHPSCKKGKIDTDLWAPPVILKVGVECRGCCWS